LADEVARRRFFRFVESARCVALADLELPFGEVEIGMSPRVDPGAAGAVAAIPEEGPLRGDAEQRRRERPVEDDDAAEALRECEIPGAHALVKRLVLALEAIGAAAGTDALRRELDGDVDEEGEIGRDAPRCDEADLEEHLDVEPSPEPLIRDGRVEEAVAEDGGPCPQPRLDHLADELRARGVQKHHLCDRIDAVGGIDEDRPQGIAQRRTAWFPGHQDGVTGVPKFRCKRSDQRRLPGRFDPFEGDEHRCVFAEATPAPWRRPRCSTSW
jgi:hypothetical protein